jgi:PIN domain nuclease of toxin-antitoxin system
MRLLLDTHVFLWVVAGSPRLKPAVRNLIEGAEAVYVSAASIWEVAIKVRLGKLQADPDALADAIGRSGFVELPVSAAHGAAVAKLAPHRDDPFDRLLMAQALVEPLRLVTADDALAKYSDVVMVV